MKAFEDAFDVKAAAPVAVAAAPAAGAGEGEGAADDANAEVDVVLDSIDSSKKIQVIKEVRALTSLGLKDAKDLVESAPKIVLEKVNKDTANDAKEKLEGAGATVSFK